MRIKQGLERYFRDSGPENAKFLDGKQDCKATLEAGFAKILAQSAGCFCLYAVNSGNHTFELQMRINRVRVEFSWSPFKPNYKVCLVCSFVFCLWKQKRSSGKRYGKKIAKCGIFSKKGAFVWDQDPHPLADRDWSKMLGSKNVFHIIT